MKKSLQRFAYIRMKVTSSRFISCKVSWLRIISLGFILTIAGILFQVSTLPYPLSKFFETPTALGQSYKSLNKTVQLTEPIAEARFQRYELLPPIPDFTPNPSYDSIQLRPVKPEINESPARRNSVSKRRKNTKTDSKPNVTYPPVPPHEEVSSQLQKYIWSLSTNEALVYAKKEIAHASNVSDDPDLYSPLFHNVSTFKRSFELMETILKVYVYPDGRRPIFHQPYLRGIYASEGWFMKLMEENSKFRTKVPEKAHLFYLPYSVRQLQRTMYVPESHDMKQMSTVIRDYVNSIAAKYPYWKRTNGSDHFIVACHDWGPYTVNQHKELSKNTIKALCNADLSEGVFISGRDVSLPETTIRAPRKPLKNIGGNRVSKRLILAFFAGNMHGRVRPELLKHWNGKDEDIKIYGPLPNRVARKMSYIQHMKSSKYCICPMGHEVNSPRIVEAIYYECVPVIIADNFVLPFSEVFKWSEFSVTVAEKDIPKLKEILLAIPLRRYLTMQINVKMVQKHFLWNPKPVSFDLFHMILHSIWSSRLNQIHIQET